MITAQEKHDLVIHIINGIVIILLGLIFIKVYTKETQPQVIIPSEFKIINETPPITVNIPDTIVFRLSELPDNYKVDMTISNKITFDEIKKVEKIEIPLENSIKHETIEQPMIIEVPVNELISPVPVTEINDTDTQPIKTEKSKEKKKLWFPFSLFQKDSDE